MLLFFASPFAKNKLIKAFFWTIGPCLEKNFRIEIANNYEYSKQTWRCYLLEGRQAYIINDI